MRNANNNSTKNSAISAKAHVIMQYHNILDELIGESLGVKKIKTTKKGIYPCYADKIQGYGIIV